MQKTVHILRELGAPFQERFEYSHYGMYSAQLKGELDALEREGLVTETQPVETNTFIIEATPKVGELLTEVGLAEPPPWVEVARRLNALPAQVLEGISTILFLRRTEDDDLVIRDKLLTLKPRLAQHVDTCFKEANSLPHFA